MKKNQIFKIFGNDYKQMTSELLEKSELSAMITDKNAKICIKPNLVVASPAHTGATTHPEVVAGIIEYLRKYGFFNIIIAEGCWIGEKTEECFENTGFRQLCEEYGVPFFDVKKAASHIKQCGGEPLKITDILNDVDFLINVPVLKGHCQVKMTCALKNVKGLVPDDEKRRFHKLGINDPVGHLSCGIHQDFIVIDNICGDLDFEEGGHPFCRNCVMTALDPVLADAYACKLFHIPTEDVPYIKIAEKLNVGSADLSAAEILSFGKTEYDAEIPASSKILDVAYAAGAVDACSECYANLIPALVRLAEENLLEKLDGKIAIGQDHKGKCGKLGVGNCTSKFDFCIKGCPPDKGTIYEQLKNYLTEK